MLPRSMKHTNPSSVICYLLASVPHGHGMHHTLCRRSTTWLQVQSIVSMVAPQLHNVWLQPQSIVSMVAPQLHNVDIEDMAPNSGATVQKGLRKVAVYKDEEGRKHAFSALCPHLGCLLQVSLCLGLPLNILPFVSAWAAFQLSGDAFCHDRTFSLFVLSFAGQVSGFWSVVHALAQVDSS